jgi:SnoaL-like domain
MLGSTPARVAIVAVALAATVEGYRWWTSPERQIQRILADVASAMSHESPETDLRALTALAAVQNHLALDVSIDAGPVLGPVSGRQEVLALAARLRASTPMMQVQVFDPEIALADGTAATTRVTLQVTARDAAGEEVASAHVLLIALARVEGHWVVTRARLLPEGETSL